MRLCSLIATLILAAALVPDCWAQSNQPAAHNNQAEQSPAPDQRGTERAPLAVRILPDQDTKLQADRSERERQEKAKVDEKLAFETRRLADYTDRLWIFTACLVGVAIVQAALFIWQLLLIRGSASDTKSAAEAAKLNAMAVMSWNLLSSFSNLSKISPIEV